MGVVVAVIVIVAIEAFPCRTILKWHHLTSLSFSTSQEMGMDRIGYTQAN